MPVQPPLPFHRTLRRGSRGYDVWAAKRAVYRLLKNEAKWQGFLKQTVTSKQTFGAAFVKDLTLAQRQLTAGVDGVLGEETLRALEDAGAFDELARHLWEQQYAKTPAAIVYPYPTGEGGAICQGLHPTAGVPGNWAIDFCDTPGARVLAVEAGEIQRLSGRSPANDTMDQFGVFGWTTYLRTAAGYVYFVTHLGWQDPALKVGSPVKAGQVIGKVGDQHFRPDHTHIGVTSPFGEADAKKRITAVSQAARVAV